MPVQPTTLPDQTTVEHLPDGTRRVFVSGHFGELLQGKINDKFGGDIGLITLPCPLLGVTAMWRDGPLSVDTRGVCPPDWAQGFLTALGVTRGTFTLSTNAPLGGGAGVSTAALVAMARVAGVSGDISQACIDAEGASDPLMFAHPERVLWASRKGQFLAPLQTLPNMEIVGGFFGAPQRTDPTDTRFADVSDLARAWAQVATAQDAAEIATQSAQRNLSLRGPKDDPTGALADKLGSIGIVIAHTGSARGLIFAPGTVPENAAITLTNAGFSNVLRFTAGGQS